jgi:hypothetical protein
MLNKHEIVLQKRAVVDQRPMGQVSYAFYGIPPEEQAVEPGHPEWFHTKYEMDLSTFAEMGEPETITLIVIPGDALNE